MTQPLVSAIMPIYGQPEMVELALASFLSQDWEPKELIVVDDSVESLRRMFVALPGVLYVRPPERQKIGKKRNLACELAQGEIIIHYDSDDWSAPNRITDQVTRLLESGKSVSGYHSMLFWDERLAAAWKYRGPADYSLGSGLCYRKEFWRKHPFVTEDHRRWEDNVFVQDARNDNAIIAADAAQRMVARIHAGNTCPKKPREKPRLWFSVEASEIPSEFLEAAQGEKPFAV